MLRISTDALSQLLLRKTYLTLPFPHSEVKTILVKSISRNLLRYRSCVLSRTTKLQACPDGMHSYIFKLCAHTFCTPITVLSIIVKWESSK